MHRLFVHRAVPLEARVHPGLIADATADASGRVLLDVTDDELHTLDRFEGRPGQATAARASCS